LTGLTLTGFQTLIGKYDTNSFPRAMKGITFSISVHDWRLEEITNGNLPFAKEMGLIK
jgi:hypothetical protein